MQFLADNNVWRNKFNDQLNCVYKDWLYKKIDEEQLKESLSENFQHQVISSTVEEIGKAVEPIKKTILFNIQKKENVRQIESNERRLVHFLFNPTVASKITPFARKYLKLIDGTLKEFEDEEAEKF